MRPEYRPHGVGIDEIVLIKPPADCYLPPRIPNYVLFSKDMYAVITHNSIQFQTWHIQTGENVNTKNHAQNE